MSSIEEIYSSKKIRSALTSPSFNTIISNGNKDPISSSNSNNFFLTTIPESTDRIETQTMFSYEIFRGISAGHLTRYITGNWSTSSTESSLDQQKQSVSTRTMQRITSGSSSITVITSHQYHTVSETSEIVLIG